MKDTNQLNYPEKINIKLLMKMGAHIGHAKIDWNTKNNAYLAGLTNNKYIIFNINKTLFFFKKALMFMRSVGLNNGTFVIYYPGDNNFYRLMMEGVLDKEGLMPTRYPFIHSIVKPGFFSNWRINYRKLVKKFFKVIFYNPFFFGSIATKEIDKDINNVTLNAFVNKDKLNYLRLKRSRFIRRFSFSSWIKKFMELTDTSYFRRAMRVSKSLIGVKKFKNRLRLNRYNYHQKLFSNENVARLQYLVKKKSKRSDTLNVQLAKTFLKIFFKGYSSLSNLCFSHKENNLSNKFLIVNFDKKLINSDKYCMYAVNSGNYRKNLLKTKLNTNVYRFINNESFYTFCYKTITKNRKINIKLKRYYDYFLFKGKESFLRNFLKNFNLRFFLIIGSTAKKKKYMKRKIEIRKINMHKRSKRLRLTNRQRAVNLKRRYKSLLGFNNKWIIKNSLDKFFNNNKSKNTPRSIRDEYKKRYFQQKDFKIEGFFDFLSKKPLYQSFRNKRGKKSQFSRIDSLKMLYYNIYEILIKISLRRKKQRSNSDALTPYEQKLFRKFIKFVLIFRYLKRIKRVPTSVLLLNPTVHESQYTDFSSLNSAMIGITDSNSIYSSLSYFIPSNDDNFILFLYYVKMISKAFGDGRKSFFSNKLNPKFAHNLSKSRMYKNSFIYQYRDGFRKGESSFFLLPHGHHHDLKHYKRLEESKKKREEQLLSRQREDYSKNTKVNLLQNKNRNYNSKNPENLLNTFNSKKRLKETNKYDTSYIRNMNNYAGRGKLKVFKKSKNPFFKPKNK
uniref:Ribosomal protein S2 n=1 Tax=Pharyngomonas kirbyi TaxID=63601 RepID=A0A1W6R278_9EUKA|nr:ribosomal protein S2 [Pharyngomonas kirbyi]ARO48003.1 ribosomal protein S2 [Pharyngomonas kirbyi]